MPRFCLNVDSNRQRVKDNMLAFIDRLPDDKPWQIDIEPLKKARTNKQNHALFGVAYAELREQTGNDKDDLHEYFCGEYFGWDEYFIMGQKHKRPIRTTTTDHEGKRQVMSAAEFSGFYAFIQRRSAENGYYVSDPDPLWNM
jgi:hypothetical protein